MSCLAVCWKGRRDDLLTFWCKRYKASLKHTEFDNMFTTTNVAKHDEIKAKLLGPYSGRELEGMEPRYVFSTCEEPYVARRSVLDESGHLHNQQYKQAGQLGCRSCESHLQKSDRSPEEFDMPSRL